MKSLFIASEVRSGSTFAAEVLSYTINKWIGEEFWDLTQEKYSSLEDISSAKDIYKIYKDSWTNKLGFTCAKIMCAALSIINREAMKDKILYDYFYGERSYWIIIKRRDKISQAVSLAYARNDGIYHSYSEHTNSIGTSVSMGEVDAALKAILVSDTYLEAFQTQPKNWIEWHYEDILNNKMAFVRDAFDLISLDYDERQEVADINLKRLSGTEKDRTVINFKQWFLQNYHRT